MKSWMYMLKPGPENWFSTMADDLSCWVTMSSTVIILTMRWGCSCVTTAGWTHPPHYQMSWATHSHCSHNGDGNGMKMYNKKIFLLVKRSTRVSKTASHVNWTGTQAFLWCRHEDLAIPLGHSSTPTHVVSIVRSAKSPLGQVPLRKQLG